jgi:hypothetical protein
MSMPPVDEMQLQDWRAKLSAQCAVWDWLSESASKDASVVYRKNANEIRKIIGEFVEPSEEVRICNCGIEPPHSRNDHNRLIRLDGHGG